MLLGISIGYFMPSFPIRINSLNFGTTNIPIALGLILMMYPPLCKIKFSKIPKILTNKKLLFMSLFITWIIGPLLMFFLSLLFLNSKPDYIIGLIIIGIAPCIAMVVVWNDLAGGNKEYVAGLVGINSILQILFFSMYAYFYLEIMLPYFYGISTDFSIGIFEVAKTVGLYLGIPFVLAILSKTILVKTKGEKWFNQIYIPLISPITLYALLFTIIIMFSLKGQNIISLPLDVLSIALPLVVYFVFMFSFAFFISKKMGAKYDETVAIAFTAAGNNFELAIAVSIGIYGINSGQALAGVIGPLVEVPVLIGLVNICKRLKF